MTNLRFPLQLAFKISTFSNDFTVRDQNQETVAYVKQKMFKLIENIAVYSNESQSTQQYSIKANQWLDFSASYIFRNSADQEIGSVARQGWASLWKARYEVFDENKKQDLLIQEENGWVKVLDALLGEIPILSIFTGYFFNPSYSVARPDGTLVARLKKDASFFGRKFSVQKLAEFESGEEERIILSLMMMILLERRRG
jgi:uncharacterized protein YxjI